MKYSFTCTCGHKITVDAATKDEAVTKIQEMMSQDAIGAHMPEKHSGDPVPTKEQSDAMIAQMVVEEVETPPAA